MDFQVSGNADKHLPGLIQQPSFTLLRSRTQSQNFKITRAAQMLTDKAAASPATHAILTLLKAGESLFQPFL